MVLRMYRSRTTKSTCTEIDLICTEVVMYRNCPPLCTETVMYRKRRNPTYVPLDRGMSVLNFAAGSFLSRNCVADFIQLKFTFIPKKEKFALWESFGRLRGNVRTSSIARWKARVRLPIRHNWTFFVSSYRWHATRQNVSKLTAFWREWVSLSQDFRGKGSSLRNIFWFLQS